LSIRKKEGKVFQLTKGEPVKKGRVTEGAQKKKKKKPNPKKKKKQKKNKKKQTPRKKRVLTEKYKKTERVY